MNPDAASLDHLHDIVLPAPVPWWPPAPGWYVVGGILLALALAVGLRGWLRWKRNAYRREARRALETAPDVATIALLLRRTALAGFAREEVAALQGEAWADWLSACGPEPLSGPLRQQFTTGVYAVKAPADLTALRAWAVHWIVAHRVPSK